MTCIFESPHHLSGFRIPFSFRKLLCFFIPLYFVSRTEKRPVSLQEYSRVFHDFFWIRNTNVIVSLLCPIDVVEYCHEDDPICKFFTFSVLVNLQVRQIIRSKMNGSFHWRRHEHSPYQHICVCNVSIERVGYPAVFSNFFLGSGRPSSCIDGLCPSCFETLFLESLPEQVSLHQQSSKIPPGRPVSRNLSFEHFPVGSSENVRLLGFGWSVQVSLYQYDYLVLHWLSPDWLGLSKSCGGFSLVLHGLRNTNSTGLAFAGTIDFGFAIGEPSLEVASWPLFDMALCFPIGSERKLLNWLQENIEKIIMLKNEEEGSTRHVWNSLWLACQQVGFWCQHVWCGSLVPSWFGRTTNQAQLWVVSHCWTSSFDNHLDDSFVLFKKCTTKARREKNVVWWARNPHLTIAQPLVFSFQLVFWSCFYWWTGLLSRTLG